MLLSIWTSPLTTPAPASLSSSQRPPPAKEYCVSYAWGDATPEGRERDALVDRLCDEAQARGTIILRDKDVLGLGDRISEFMKRIGRADRVFIVLSDKYLKSPFCMFELNEVWRTSKLEGETFLQRIRVYALPSAKIWDPLGRTQYAIYWKQKHDELEALEKEHGYAIIGEIGMQTLRRMREFSHNVSDVLATVADVLHLRTFDDFIRFGLDDTGPPAGNADELPPLPVQPANDSPGLGSATNEPPSASALSAASSLSAPPTADQERLATELLAVDEAAPLRQVLSVEIKQRFREETPADPADLVGWFAACPHDQAEQALDVVRKAVAGLAQTRPAAGALLPQIEEAAVALYCLAACRLIDRAVHEESAKLSGARSVIMVPTNDAVACAVIATALIGGRLSLLPAEEPGHPRAEFAFVVPKLTGGDRVADDFERACYLATAHTFRDAPTAALDSERLSDDQRAWFMEAIRDKRVGDDRCVTFVVPYSLSLAVADNFSRIYSDPVPVPVLIHDETVKNLLGVDAARLKYRIINFWRAATSQRQPGASPAERGGDRTAGKSVMTTAGHDGHD